MDGKPFLGKNVNTSKAANNDETFGMADRFDEKYDMVRSLRKGNFKYMRNYQPFNPDGLQNNYRYLMVAYTEWRNMYKAGKLNEVQSQFFEPRGPEALYDIANDPYETVNLAGDPKYAAKLNQLRTRLTEWVKGLADLSFYPESHLAKNAFNEPVKFGQKHKAEIADLVDIADLQLVCFDKAKAKVHKALNSDNTWHRYWALIVCSTFGKEASAFIDKAGQIAANDANPLNRVRAAEFLGLIEADNPVPVIKDVLAKTVDPLVALLTLNTVVMLEDGKPGYKFNITPDSVRAKGSEVNRRLQYLAGVKIPKKKRKPKNNKPKA